MTGCEMAREYKLGDEPIPGYRIAKFLGRGGFGEVWRAVGPGGTEVALKSIALDRKQGMKEFKSLRLVKRIHHPNLVPILAFWLVDNEGNPLDDDNIDLLGSNLVDSMRGVSASTGTATMQFNAAKAEQLVIAMGLGEKNLLDLLKEYQGQGLTGIPLEELLDYMEGSARAIDFLNTARHDLGKGQPVAIQHCDIKPQNIMLVGDAVQVCDFGLARSLTDVRSTSVAGSIAYGAPELFWENKPTHATDQYSLAITYYELRTGHLPFGPDMAAIEVMQAHRDGKLDLHHLNDAERAVIKRATDPTPSGRFERTIDMVRALRRATQGGSQILSVEGGARMRNTGIRSSIVQTGREIVPGFTLLEHLFHPDARTDVWSASAPGGKPQAIWLYDLTASPGAIDREALKLIQALTDHPRLSRLSGWWLLNNAGGDMTNEPTSASHSDDQPTTLVLAGELTRTNLAHRVEECRQFRGKGIPLEELLGYMQQVAEAVDALNDASHSLRGSKWVSLIHTDLRPANLLVFGSAVKVGNFAWCRTLEGEDAEVFGMPVRAARPTMAPELAAGRVHRRTDQYSLAASYVQMRTGNLLLESGLPTGAASGALVGSSLDFSALSEGETEIIQRAMHADPHQRYPSCRKMVAELALAIKKMPVGIVETVYPAAVGAAFGGGTMMPGDLLSHARPETATVPVAVSTGDTQPDVRKTVEEAFSPAAARSWSWKPKVTVPLTVLLMAGAAGLFTGHQLQTEVQDLVGRREYKSAVEALKQPRFWQSWRTKPEELRRWVVSEAIDAAKGDAETEKVEEALRIYGDLAAVDALSSQNITDFREKVLPAAIDSATGRVGEGDFKKAADIHGLLGQSFKENVKVDELGHLIRQRWEEVVREHLEKENFQSAASIYQQLGDANDEDLEGTILDLRTRIISEGRQAIARHAGAKEFAAALDIGQQLNSVKEFRDDTGLMTAVSELFPQAIAEAERELGAGKAGEAKSIYNQLAQLRRGDSKLKDLGQEILAHELANPRAALKAKDWAAALIACKRIAQGWPYDDWAKEEINALRGQVIQAAGVDFEAAVKSGDKNLADEICTRLEAPLGKDKDPRVDAMRAKFDRLFKGGIVPFPPAADVAATELLDQADENIGARLFDQAAEQLLRVHSLIDEKLPGRADLRRRLALARAYLDLQGRKWKEATELLGQFKDNDFNATTEPAQRCRFHLLTALAQAEFDGGGLAEDVEIEPLSQAVGELRQNQPDWRESDDRLLVGRVKELSRELGRRAIELAGHDDREKRSLADRVLARLDPADVADISANAQVLLAVNKTAALLADRKTSWPKIQGSLEKWKSDVDKVGTEQLGRFVKELSRWARVSDEPDALKKVIDEVGRWPRKNDELRREYAGLLIDQLLVDASQPQIDWTDLDEKCRRIEDVSEAGNPPRAYLVRACQAECALETGSSRGLQSAKQELFKADVDQQDRAYIDYVLLRVLQATKRIADQAESAELADRLCEALKGPPPMLTTELRRRRSGELLFEAARSLIGEPTDDPLAPPAFAKPDDAGRAYRWLGQARDLGDILTTRLSDEFRLLLAAAALAKKDPDSSLANALLDELIKGPAPQPNVLLMAARSLEPTAPLEAVRRYADTLQAVLKLDNGSSQTIYEQVVAPAIHLVESLPPQQVAPIAKSAAELYATKGRFIRLDAAVDLKVFEETQTSGADAIFDAYDKAIKLDDSVADYFIQRGTARYDSVHNDLQALKRDDIGPARKLLGDKQTVGLSSLTGVAHLLEARVQTGLDAKAKCIEFYKQAVADERQAVDQCDPRSEDYPQVLRLLSYACLELANFTTEPDDAIRGYLGQAVESARQAIADGRGAHPEFALQALGNADEDHGLLLRDYSGYRRAIDDFDNARLKALENFSSPDEALICLGRAGYRLALSGAESASASDKLLSEGLTDLQAAIDSKRLAPARLIEAYWWQAQIHSAQAQQASARASSPAARNNAALIAEETRKFNTARNAANAAMTQCVERLDGGSPAWPTYQLYWAGLGAAGDEMRNRARPLLESTSKADGGQRAQAIALIANSYRTPNSRGPQLRRELEQGLREYQRYLPWLPDVSKAKADETPALLGLSEFILSDRDFWRDKWELCKTSAERALMLAGELRAADLVARAHADLAQHGLFAANKQTTVDLASLARAAEHLKDAVDFDNKLADAGLTALERQAIRQKPAPDWRLALAGVDGRIAADPRTAAAERKRLRDEGIKALREAKELPGKYTQLFQDQRLKLLKLQ